MKKYIFILTLFVVSCDSDDAYIPQFENGYVEAEVNGNLKKWEAQFYNQEFVCNGRVTDDYNFMEFNDEGFLRVNLVFEQVPQEVGYFEIVSRKESIEECSPRSYFFGITADGDAGDGKHELDTLKVNFINITDRDTSFIRGEFSVNFKTITLPQTPYHLEYKDSVSIKNAEFLIRL